MTDQALAFQATLHVAYGDAIDLVREALKKEGFGIWRQLFTTILIKII